MIVFRYVLSPYNMMIQDQILVVRTQNGVFGFPKGGMIFSNDWNGPHETIFQNAVREQWAILKNAYLDKPHIKCRYLSAAMVIIIRVS